MGECGLDCTVGVGFLREVGFSVLWGSGFRRIVDKLDLREIGFRRKAAFMAMKRRLIP